MKFSQISISSIAVCNLLLLCSLLLPSKVKDCDTALVVVNIDDNLPNQTRCLGLFDYFPSTPSLYVTGHQIRLFLDLLDGKSACFSNQETLDVISSTIFQTNHQYFIEYKAPDSGTGMVMMLEKGNEYGIWAEIQILRKLLQSNMKLELFHQGDVDLNFIKEFTLDANTDVVDLSLIFGNNTFTYNQWIPFAILASKFRSIMVADSSLTFLLPPDQFAETEVFQKYGAVLFQNQMPSKKSRTSLYSASGSLSKKPFANSAAFSKSYAGVMMIDKQKHKGAVLAACASVRSRREVGSESFDYLAAGFAVVGNDFAHKFSLPVVDENGALRSRSYEGAHFYDKDKICWYKFS